MFFKITKGKCQDYLYIVESYRDEAKKIKHRKICSLGQLSKVNKTFVESFAQLLKTSPELAFVDLTKAFVAQKVNYGGTEVVNYFWQYFALNSVMKNCN